MSVDLTKLSFYSGVNYMKRYGEDSGLVGTTLVTLPTSGNAVTHTVTHNLGFVPDVFVASIPDNDGVIWSNEKVHALTGSSAAFGAAQVEQVIVSHWVTTTQLGIVVRNMTTTAAGQQRRIYWVIYRDYSS